MARDAWAEAERRKKVSDQLHRFEKYAQDPIGFAGDILGDHFTPSVIQVIESVRDYQVTVARSANGVGKTHAAARIAIWFYLCFPQSQVYLVAAPPLDNLKRILWGEIMSVVTKHPHLFEMDKIRSLSINRGPRCFISGVAIPTSGTEKERESKFSGKHSPHQLFVVDEGDAVPEEVYTGIESCMSGEHARMLIMFNPRHPAGHVYRRELDHRANVVHLSAFDHPNVITGENVIAGAVTREITLRRIHEWTRPLVAGENEDAECFRPPAYLVGQIGYTLGGQPYPILENAPRKIVDPSFSYMVMGDYPAQGDTQLISADWVYKARARYDEYVKVHGNNIPEGISPKMGLDIAELGIDWNVCCLRYDSYVAPLLMWQGIDTDATATKSLAIYNERNVNIAMVDATGVGSSVAPAMARRGRADDVRAIAVKVGEKPTPGSKTEQGEFYSLRDQLWWACREWLRTDPDAMLPPDPALVEELKTPTYTVKDNGKIKVLEKETLRKLLKRSTDRADALCLTFAPFEKAKIMRLVG